MKNFKNIFTTKTLITCLTLVAMFTLASVSFFAGETPAFKDVPATHWGYQNIQRAYNEGVVSGSSYDEATGVRKYSPEDKVTMAEFCTIITRAFYADELAASTAEGSWYAAAQDVVKNHRWNVGYFNIDNSNIMNGAASRYDMAGILYGVLKDKGVTMPTDAELTVVQGQIGDWNDLEMFINKGYQKPVSTVVALGLITGKDANGTFAGSDSLTRAEVATIYCRVADLINGKTIEKPVVDQKPETPVTPITPEKPEQPATGNYGAVGTLSDTPVTLSFSTHKPVVDYWSRTSAEVQAATDKDMFNAAVQTIKDKDIAEQPTGNAVKSNEYYNYAVYNWNIDDENKRKTTSRALPLDFGAERKLENAEDSNLTIVVYRNAMPDYEDVFAPILAKLNDNMTDKQKAEILIQAVVDRFDYGKGVFNWHSENKIGDCDNYADAVNRIFSAADIPVSIIADDTSQGPHMWNRAYIDGQWYAVDAVCAERNRAGIMTYSEHANLFGYDTSLYSVIGVKIEDALWNAVLNQ